MTESFSAPLCSSSALLVSTFSVMFGFSLQTASFADQHTAGVPQLSSRPGAAYTIYLDVAGFNYDGNWRGSGTPGTTLAVNDLASTATFSAADQDQIKIMWSRLAQEYVGMNVNVTTIDPAISANQAGTDAARQAYYDATPNMMHTIVGSQIRAGNVKWYSNSADGVSGLDVIAGRTDGVNSSAGDHTNWMFSEDQAGAGNGGVINGDYIGSISAHENGHAFGLNHQGDWTGNTNVNEYTNGDASNVNGSYVATMGNASDRQRVTWRVGDTNAGGTKVTVNDVKAMLSIDATTSGSLNGRTGAANLHLVEDGIGHARTAASTLPIRGDGTVNFSLATGVIVPLSESNPQALGAANYTQDWFSFTLATASTITLTAHDGTQFITAGVADGVGTMRSTLSIFNSVGGFLSSALEDSSTLFETYTGSLNAGTYYANIASFGGHVENSGFNSATYFDVGAYFLTGSGFALVPEPSATMLCLFIACGAMLKRRRAKIV